MNHQPGETIDIPRKVIYGARMNSLAKFVLIWVMASIGTAALILGWMILRIGHHYYYDEAQSLNDPFFMLATWQVVAAVAVAAMVGFMTARTCMAWEKSAPRVALTRDGLRLYVRDPQCVKWSEVMEIQASRREEPYAPVILQFILADGRNIDIPENLDGFPVLQDRLAEVFEGFPPYFLAKVKPGQPPITLFGTTQAS